MDPGSVLEKLFSDFECMGFVEIRPLPYDPAYPSRFFKSPSDAAEYARSLDGKKDVYFGACTRGQESGTRKDVKAVGAVWADCDTPESVRNIRDFPLKPTIEVETSPGRRQFWWLLKEPIILDEDAGAVARVLGVLYGIADVLKSDLTVTELARIMRVPGTQNVKRGAPCTVIYDDGPRYELDDFINLGIYRDKKPVQVSGNGHDSDPENWVTIALAGVDEIDPGRNATAARLAGYLLRKHPPDITRELLHGFALRCRPPMEMAEVNSVLDSIGKTIKRETPGTIVTPTTTNGRTSTLAETVSVFEKWLCLPDPDPLYAVFGAIAANRAQGDPIWLLMVAGSSWGKSEILQAAGKLPDVHAAATLTEASLLSGTASRDKAKDAKGGLLRAIGDYGIILCKDFGSILNMSRDPRASTLAALREMYDGSWTRHVGTDGGQSLHWEGKVGFLGGCTPVIDRHHAVMSSMGERFVFVRLPDKNGEALARRALEHAGKERVMRAEMSAAVNSLFGGLKTDSDRPGMTDDERARLIALTTLTVRCRSSIERDSYSREIELVPGAESPGRLTRVAANLLAGLHVVGLDRPGAWRVTERVLLDSMPQLLIFA